jgi:hypothetical protein
VIADITHRIDGFSGRACSNDHALAAEGFLFAEGTYSAEGSLPIFDNARKDRGRFQHATRPDVATGLGALIRSPQLNLRIICQQVDISAGPLIAPHGLIHGGRQRNGRFCCTTERGQQVIGHAVRQPRHKICRGGGNHDLIRPFGQLNVAHACFGLRVQQ